MESMENGGHHDIMDHGSPPISINDTKKRALVFIQSFWSMRLNHSVAIIPWHTHFNNAPHLNLFCGNYLLFLTSFLFIFKWHSMIWRKFCTTSDTSSKHNNNKNHEENRKRVNRKQNNSLQRGPLSKGYLAEFSVKTARNRFISFLVSFSCVAVLQHHFNPAFFFPQIIHKCNGSLESVMVSSF